MMLFDLAGVIRNVMGFVFIVFIPGYVLIFTLFPTRKTDKGIDIVQRIALSFGFSIAVVSLILFGLNYTLDIQLNSVSLFLTYFVLIFGFIGLYRWHKTPRQERFVITLEIPGISQETKIDKVLTILLVFSLLIAAVAIIYIINNPKEGEHYTEFYLLGPNDEQGGYPENLKVGDKVNGTLGVLNHEYRTINYTIGVWLVNQTSVNNQTIYNNMWFIDKIITNNLTHFELNTNNLTQPYKKPSEIIQKPNIRQYEKNISYTITRGGLFKLTFFLYKNSTNKFITNEFKFNEDYKDNASEIIGSAYRELHLWINVTDFYILPDNKTIFGPDEAATGLIGIRNNENRTTNYTIEIWLINQTLEKNQTIYNNMWFINKITTNKSNFNSIGDKKLNITKAEINYTVTLIKITDSLIKTGFFKLTFLLYTTPTDSYITDKDYKDIAIQKINSAYRELHIWIYTYR
jgi:uncharacterized membrane protein